MGHSLSPASSVFRLQSTSRLMVRIRSPNLASRMTSVSMPSPGRHLWSVGRLLGGFHVLGYELLHRRLGQDLD